MLCDHCGKNHATTHIRSVVNGVVTEKNLCGYCAAKLGYSGSSENTLAGMLASVFEDVLAGSSKAPEKCCPVCGAAFSDIAEKGKAGCAECYNTFYEELLPYLKRVHGGTRHTGKIPNQAPLAVKPEKETAADLKIKLGRLVAEEKFEEAAVLRDEIKKLEAQENE